MRAGKTLSLMLGALVSPVLMAQSPHVGFGLHLTIPTGDFSSSRYFATYASGTEAVEVVETEGYDPGLGAYLSLSFPVDPRLALRMEFSGQSESGTNTAPGYPTIYLRHQLFSIAGQAQVFLGSGSAYRHKGTYLMGGISADFERFERSYDDAYYDDSYYQDGYGHDGLIESERKSRMGGLLGVGHAFGAYDGGRFTLELAYHKTLSGHDFIKGEPVAADYLRLGFGWVF